MSFFTYPKILSLNNNVIKYMDTGIHFFQVEISIQEVCSDKNKMNDIILDKLKRMNGKVNEIGLINNIIKIVSRTPGIRNDVRSSGGIIYGCMVSCTISEFDNDMILCGVEIITSDSKGLFYGKYNDKINVVIDGVNLTDIHVGMKVNIRIKDVKGLRLGSSANQLAILAAPFIMYDIPLSKRSISFSTDGKRNFKFNPKFDTSGALLLNKYGYFANNFDELEKIMTGMQKWDNCLKAIINPYDMLKPISKYKKMVDSKKLYDILNKKYKLNITSPLSRGYFKLIEILYFNNLKTDNLNFAAIADAPGGFTQAFMDTFGSKAKVLTTSLNGGYDKSIKADMLKTGDGDITKIENIRYFENMGNKYSIVACDGVFDHDKYHQPKEVLHTQLLLAEMVCCLLITELKGTCIVKLYTRFTDPTVKLIYWFSTYFENCKIYKPRSSRISSDEVFFIGNKFKGKNKLIQTAINSLSIIKSQSGNYKRFFTNIIETELPDDFLVMIYKYNKYLNGVKKFCYNFANELNQNQIDIHKYINYQIKKCGSFLN